MRVPLKVLILEDSADDAELLVEDLRAAEFEPSWTRAEDEPGFRAGLLDGPDIVIADYRLPQFDAMGALAVAADVAPDIPVIVVSGVMTEETCVQCLHRGAVDYLLKDRLTRLGPAVRHALARKRLESCRQEAERAAQESAAILQEMVDGAPSLICLTDDEGRFVLANSEFERVVGVVRDELLGRGPADVLSVAFARVFAEGNAACLKSHRVLETEEVLSHRDETNTYVSVRYPLTLAGGMRGVAAIYTNISRQKQTEQALREAQDALHVQAAELSAANVELQELDELRNQFITNVSHELRTPLTSILGYTEILATEEMLPPAVVEMVSAIDRNGQRLLGLIEDLLLFTRIDKGNTRAPGSAVNVADIVTRCCASFLPMAENAGITLHSDVGPDLASVHAEPRELERVMRNLLSNAVKFSLDGGVVTVTCRRIDAPEGVSITVRDMGIGIPPDEQSKIFTRFFRSSASDENAIRGTGLGLAICKAIVEGYGGQIAVESTEGVGTSVTVTLPCTGIGIVPA